MAFCVRFQLKRSDSFFLLTIHPNGISNRIDLSYTFFHWRLQPCSFAMSSISSMSTFLFISTSMITYYFISPYLFLFHLVTTISKTSLLATNLNNISLDSKNNLIQSLENRNSLFIFLLNNKHTSLAKNLILFDI